MYRVQPLISKVSFIHDFGPCCNFLNFSQCCLTFKFLHSVFLWLKMKKLMESIVFNWQMICSLHWQPGVWSNVVIPWLRKVFIIWSFTKGGVFPNISLSLFQDSLVFELFMYPVVTLFPARRCWWWRHSNRFYGTRTRAWYYHSICCCYFWLEGLQNQPDWHPRYCALVLLL